MGFSSERNHAVNDNVFSYATKLYDLLLSILFQNKSTIFACFQLLKCDHFKKINLSIIPPRYYYRVDKRFLHQFFDELVFRIIMC